MLGRTDFPYVESYVAAEVSLELDWKVVAWLNWVPYSWDTGAAHSIDAFESTHRENCMGVIVVQGAVVIPSSAVHFTRADVVAANHWFRDFPISPSRASPEASPPLSRLEDVYVGDLDAAWDIEGDNGPAVASGDLKEVRV